MSRRRVLLPLLSLALLPGCETYSLSRDARSPIPEHAVQFVQPGETSREDVLLRLGQPYWVAEDSRLLIYCWIWRVVDNIFGNAHLELELYLVLLDEAGTAVASGFCPPFTVVPGLWVTKSQEARVGEWLRENTAGCSGPAIFGD